MKKFVIIIFILSPLLTLSGKDAKDEFIAGKTEFVDKSGLEMNSNTKYKDAEKILTELIKLYQDLIFKVESTNDPLMISIAMNEFSSSLNNLIPEMKRINNKYPELKNFNTAPPDELRNQSDMLEALEPRLKEAFFKIKILSDDKNIKKAMDDLHEILLKMGNSN